MSRPRRSMGPEPGFHVLDGDWDDCEAWTAWVMERLVRGQGAPMSLRVDAFLPSGEMAGGTAAEAVNWQAAHKAKIAAKLKAAEAKRAWAAKEAEWEKRREDDEATAKLKADKDNERLEAYWQKRKEDDARLKAEWKARQDAERRHEWEKDEARQRQSRQDRIERIVLEQVEAKPWWEEALQAPRKRAWQAKEAAAEEAYEREKPIWEIAGFPLPGSARKRDAERARILAAPWQCKTCLKPARIDPHMGGFQLSCSPCGEMTFGAHELLVRVLEAQKA